MDAEQLRSEGCKVIDIVADYWESMRKRRPLPDVKPGFMNQLVRYLIVRLVVILLTPGISCPTDCSRGLENNL